MGSLRPALEASSVGYRYPSGRVGVAEASLTVDRGERVVLMGPNGSGKSSLLRLVTGELHPTRGRLSVLGRRPGSMNAADRRLLGVAGDRPVHIDALTGRENALLFARAAGLDGATASDRADAFLGRFDLAGVAGVPVGEYSHGMRRKLLLVQALAHRPALAVLDEPTLGLDPPAVEALVAALASAAERGASALVATNDLGAASRLADRIVFLHEGRVAAEGAPRELLARVADRQTAVEVLFTPSAGGPGRGRATPSREAVVRRVADALPGASVHATPGGVVARLAGGTAEVPRLVESLVAAGAAIRSLEIREPHLGDVFRAVTGRELVEGSASSGAGA